MQPTLIHNALAGLVALGLALYLLATLIAPERF